MIISFQSRYLKIPVGMRSSQSNNLAGVQGSGHMSPIRVTRGGAPPRGQQNALEPKAGVPSARAVGAAAGTGNSGNPFPRDNGRQQPQPQAGAGGGGGGGLMSFIFGGGNQDRQGRPSPQMVKLPQVG